ncbi:MAG TPA: hypothetical protein VFJ15_08785 [Oleiagrimonas sp.]|nr:hypothetical protein [Oleiagrimonas sp.]
MKAKFAEFPAAFVTYAPLPVLPAGGMDAWKLNWNGLIVPIPALPYIRFSVSGDDHEVVLGTADHQYVFVSRAHEIGPSHGIQARKRDTGNAASATPASVFDIIAHGFAVTPDDLHCSATHAEEQARVAMALVLKTIASPARIVAAHEVAGWRTGLLKYGHGSSGTDFYVYLLQRDADEDPYDVRYRVATASDTRRAVLSLAHPRHAVYADAPTWLAALQGYLDAPLPETRCALAASLDEAGFAERDVRRLAQQSPACEGDFH